jgi:predicted nucleic acid-binding protein
MRLFLDANVIFSAAHNPDGNAHGLFRLATKGWCILLTSPYALEEAERNVALRYPALIDELDRLTVGLEVVPEARREQITWALSLGLPQKDAPILAAAAQAGAACLVTGDKRHFGHLYGKKLGLLTVKSPADALKSVLIQRARR